MINPPEWFLDILSILSVEIALQAERSHGPYIRDGVYGNLEKHELVLK